MTRITVDADLLTKLQNLRQPLELCDPSGRVLAQVVPAPDLSKYKSWEPNFTEEELRAAEQSDEWYTTEEVLAYLEKL
jgi:hypothetical protein